MISVLIMQEQWLVIANMYKPFVIDVVNLQQIKFCKNLRFIASMLVFVVNNLSVVKYEQNYIPRKTII